MRRAGLAATGDRREVVSDEQARHALGMHAALLAHGIGGTQAHVLMALSLGLDELVAGLEPVAAVAEAGDD
jgi:hypothetical protein